MDKMNGTLQKIKGGWINIDRKKRNALVTALMATILFVGFYSWYSGKVTYATLFTNLELEDAAAITADLDTRGNIPYRILNGGKDIEIDEKYVDKYRLDLAMNGMMPENSTGFEIFDNMGMMVTDEDRKIMYQRALEGELQRSVMSLSEIRSARVHLVMSKDSIFETEKTLATASVILDIKAGAKVTGEAVKGIVALISGAVDNLPEENVRIIDSSGNLLSAGLASGGEGGMEVISQQSEYKKSFENEVKNNILSLLGPAFGPDKIKVSVFADLDFDAQEQTVISYKDPVIRSQNQSATGSGNGVGGVVNSPVGDNAQNVLDGNGEGGLSSYEGTVNYELTESTTTTVKAPGKINRITTSILYDGQLTDVQKAAINNLVATATGYSFDRGDQISVEGVAFDKTYQEEVDKELARLEAERVASLTFMDRYGEYIYFGIFGLLGTILLLSVLRILFGKKSKVKEYPVAPVLPVMVEEPKNLIEELYQKFEVKENPKEKQIKEYAQEHPEIAADLIKAWMKD